MQSIELSFGSVFLLTHSHMPVLRCSTMQRAVAEELSCYQEDPYGLPAQSDVSEVFKQFGFGIH